MASSHVQTVARSYPTSSSHAPKIGTVENHGKKMVKNTAHFCENRKNHGKITAVYIAANLLKLTVSNSRKTYILGKIHNTMTSRSHILPASNKAHGLW